MSVMTGLALDNSRAGVSIASRDGPVEVNEDTRVGGLDSICQS